MAVLLYKKHSIIATSRFDKELDSWIPIADVSWQSSARRRFHIIKSSFDRFRTKE
jgi:hypothetical protein